MSEKVKKRNIKKKRRKRASRVLLTLLFVFLLIGFTLSVTVLFPIKKISVGGESIYSAHQIIEASNIDEGDNIFLLGKNSAKKIIRKLPYISKVTFKRTLPDKILIKVSPAQAKMCYYNGKSYLLTDDDGRVLEKVKSAPQNMLIITTKFDNNIKISDKIKLSQDYDFEVVNTVYDFAKKEKIKLNGINVLDKINISISVEDRFDVFLGDRTDLDNKLSHLSAMLDKIEPDAVGDINLRSWSKEKPEGYLTRKTVQNQFNSSIE